MDFETFKEELANSVKERLDSRGSEEYSVTLNKQDHHGVCKTEI